MVVRTRCRGGALRGHKAVVDANVAARSPHCALERANSCLRNHAMRCSRRLSVNLLLTATRRCTPTQEVQLKSLDEIPDQPEAAKRPATTTGIWHSLYDKDAKIADMWFLRELSFDEYYRKVRTRRCHPSGVRTWVGQIQLFRSWPQHPWHGM